MIEVKDLKKGFNDVEVLKGISAEFIEGQTNLIIGQSGSGKTVFLKSLVGLHQIDHGEILYDGRELSGMNDAERKSLRTEMGMVFQGNALFDSRTIEDNVKFALDMFSNLSKEEKLEYLESMGLHEPGLDRIIKAGFKLLGLQTYFTCGPKEARAWTVRVGAKAPEAAGCIHTDFEKGFIKAEVIAFDDYLNGGEQGAKDAGKMRQEGKEYVVADGDVITFRFNV